MKRGVFRSGLILVAALWPMAPSCGAQDNGLPETQPAPAFGLRSLHILHLMLLDLEPARVGRLRRGETEWDLGSVYANTFSTSTFVNQYHEAPQYRGQPLQLDEVIGLHRAHAQDPLLLVDGEAIRTALSVRYGLSPSVSVSLEVPYIYRDVSLDTAIRSFHRHVHQDQNGRDLFPKGELAVLVQSPGEPFTFFQGTRRSGVGDIVGSVGWRPPLSSKGLAYGADLILKAPTGEAAELNGSGGWDTGLLLFLVWQRAGWTLEADGGYVFPGAWKAPLKLETDPFGRLFASVIRDLGRRTRIGASVTVEQSPFRDGRAYTLARSGVEIGLGVEQDVLAGLPVRLTLTKGLPKLGDRVDFSVALALRLRMFQARVR